MSALPLVDHLALLLERTYDIESGVVPLGRFVVGDEGHERLTAGRTVRERVDHAGSAARLLLRRLAPEAEWAAALYLPDALVSHLERHDPRRGLSAANVDEFATLVEEIDHLVTFAERSAAGVDVSLLELEWHAAISKYLTLTHFAARLAGTTQVGDEARAFIEHRVFHAGEFCDPDPDVRDRYREAHRLGLLFVRRLRDRSIAERVTMLRRFHRASAREKLETYS